MFRPITVLSVATVAALAAAAGVFGAASAFTAAPAARVAKAADGHYWAMASIDGRPLRMLVDTGATSLALTLTDARALGLDTAALVYDRQVATAAGRTQAASVSLSRVGVDGVDVEHVAALVVKTGLPSSLLGMSFLGRLSGFQADRSSLVLRR